MLSKSHHLMKYVTVIVKRTKNAGDTHLSRCNLCNKDFQGKLYKSELICYLNFLWQVMSQLQPT
jgi:hypothetical protein